MSGRIIKNWVVEESDPKRIKPEHVDSFRHIASHFGYTDTDIDTRGYSFDVVEVTIEEVDASPDIDLQEVIKNGGTLSPPTTKTIHDMLKCVHVGAANYALNQHLYEFKSGANIGAVIAAVENEDMSEDLYDLFDAGVAWWKAQESRISKLKKADLCAILRTTQHKKSWKKSKLYDLAISYTVSSPGQDTAEVKSDEELVDMFQSLAVYDNKLMKELGEMVFSSTGTSDTQMSAARHEAAVLKIIVANGFKEISDRNNLGRGRYVTHQPFGSQKAPDIMMTIVDEWGERTLWLECKSGNNTITWNDGFPKINILYLFHCRKNKTNTFFHGSDLREKNAVSIYDDMIERKDTINTELKESMSDLGMECYLRLKWSQRRIGSIKTNTNRIKSMVDGFMRAGKRTAVSLFAGAGGDTLGMEIAGMSVIGFVEKDEKAAETHLKNFPQSKHMGKNVCDVPDKTYTALCGDVDVVFAGFPCQGFSRGGKKNVDDPRNSLYKEFVRATALMRPKWVIGENVKGILTMSKDGTSMADVVVGAFDEIGYSMSYNLINARDFGVAQDRKRVVFVGSRDGAAPDIPTSNEAAPKCLRDVLEFSLADAVPMPASLEVPRESVIVGSGEVSGKPPTNLAKCAAEATELDRITYSVRKKPTFSAAVDLADVSRTLLCTYARMPRLFVACESDGAQYVRPYTVLECQRIQGFPDTFEFCGDDKDAIRQIGNAVPPPMIAAVVAAL
jgi:DNA (cytosine-5)-methyltransferase 1